MTRSPNGMSLADLPTVVLEECAMYWVKPRYGRTAGLWTVARWEVGSFWAIGGGEVSPEIICGPIPRPAENSAKGSERSDEGNPATDEPPLYISREEGNSSSTDSPK